MITYTMFGCVERIEDVPDGATIETVDGQPVVALCEGCGKPIVDNDTGNQWSDGVWTCDECGGPQDDLETPD